MLGKHVGFVNLLQKELGRPLLSLHCIIHEENVCTKASSKQLNEVMSVVIKITNTIIARSALNHRKFKTFLEQIECEYSDLLMHTEVRWLSRGKVLNRFVACINAIEIFMSEIGESFPQLKDKNWLLKLKFLTDITNHFNNLNLRLQSKEQTILKLYEAWKSFCCKLVLFQGDIMKQTFKYFPSVKTHEEITNAEVDMLKTYIDAIQIEFETRFQNFKAHGPMFSFIIKPDGMEENVLDLQYFNFLEIENLDMELIDFKNSTIWTDKFKALRRQLHVGHHFPPSFLR
ncbi:general transcription factor II-I repeat domain-containing protein 2-like [Limulus polyphemus]|uniref:General transcription factor II-I repeat domain-containing protein 2-like n=1 Tax=Limulus polyphemus TaxID=6850 RepID=A0ABM1BQ09_LIMPO|nr:general transcription factor II-I repeat domain-containing protein 2-like [Limulus polyphemus]